MSFGLTIQLESHYHKDDIIFNASKWSDTTEEVSVDQEKRTKD